MRNRNMATIDGRLGFDPEIKFSAKNTAICNFDLAVTYDEETHWVPVSLFGKAAEILGAHAKKGDLVGVSGRLVVDKWEKDGQKYSKMKINAFDIFLYGSNKKDGDRQTNDHDEQKRNGYQQQPPSEPAMDDDIPF